MSKQKILVDAIHTSSRVTGDAHAFYKYPARFSPVFARSFIEELTPPGSWVLDPFMGGGTSVVESITSGRRIIGSDLSSLASFVSKVRTTPLSDDDKTALRGWFSEQSLGRHASSRRSIAAPIRNVPDEVERVCGNALHRLDRLPRPRQREFARAVLLKTAQWATEREAGSPPADELASTMMVVCEKLFAGLDELVEKAREVGVAKNQITSRRRLFHTAAANLLEKPGALDLRGKVRLVVTSPPYPGVHVLYHRWQVRGRKETAAPFWIAGVQDGQPESYYTFGGRKQPNFDRYYRSLEDSFAGVLPLLHPKAVVAQLVAFTEPETQLDRFMSSMASVGYKDATVAGLESGQTREVPGRRWYAQLRGSTPSSREHLILHQPAG